jgi:outer membrane protein
MNQLMKFAILLCTVVSATASLSQAAGGRPAVQNIVMVSFNDVVLHTAEAQKALSILQTQYAPRQSQLQTLNGEVEALRKKLDNAAEKATDAERATGAAALDRKEKQLQRQAEDLRQDSQAESQQIFQRIAQKTFAFLQNYAQQRGYSAVIERGSDASPVVWYVADSLDITDQLVKAYDAQSGMIVPQPRVNPSNPGTTKVPEPLPNTPSPHP